MYKIVMIVVFLGFGYHAYTDTWVEATKNDLNGTWEGSVNEPIPADPGRLRPQSSIAVTMRVTYKAPAQSITLTVRADMKQFVTDLSAMQTMKDRGFTKEWIWEALSREFTGSNFSVGAYNVTADISSSIDTFMAPDSSTIFIDKPKKKLKIMFHSPMTFGLGDYGFTEIILAKQ
ncbi:MAG: hypothetical protein LBG73_07245 [Spirochaetaceae bacterium]|jgi:hypothetical protein|nr:hypothetical protein [Spirochaetaceae bacterium]